MNILGIGAFEILVIFLIAFLILGPEKMSQFSKKFGNFVKKIRDEKEEFSSIIDESVKDINEDMKIQNPFKDDIRQLCSSMTNANFHCDVDKIGVLMKTSDLAIGAGGSTTWERCCLGLPSLVSVISEDQLECTRVMGKEGHIIYLGLAKKLTIHDYVIGIKNLDIQNLQKISKLNLKLVDGQGCQRILDEMRLLN